MSQLGRLDIGRLSGNVVVLPLEFGTEQPSSFGFGIGESGRRLRSERLVQFDSKEGL
jgi:hypothetical protein